MTSGGPANKGFKGSITFVPSQQSYPEYEEKSKNMLQTKLFLKKPTLTELICKAVCLPKEADSHFYSDVKVLRLWGAERWEIINS